MRTVVCLFDAPVPARAGIAALLEAGFDEKDIGVTPQHAGDPLPDVGAVATDLARRGIDPFDADAYAEGVARGGILVFVTCPTARSSAAVAALDGVGGTDIEELRAHWRARPNTRYPWRERPAPRLVGR